jgi:hypothetical protein
VLVRFDNVALTDLTHFRIFPRNLEPWQRIGNQIDAAMICARSDFLNVPRRHYSGQQLAVSHSRHLPKCGAKVGPIGLKVSRARPE